ncbi:hypothetical protein [Parapusillimonas granuli]|uniref:Uncharacterized protein n=1 Tax=Parapusillimonas granuli TaxID=380911 RepID=A0A853G041_9BURK|nr:hypothetical protein [Parapusillimonas granuli]MBB5215664.1 hypothetical protein [Parapusillimonas granuli]NYT49669.1 hypothetical protein [Parapusillimonas granuli]
MSERDAAYRRAGGLPDANLAGLLFRLEHSTASTARPLSKSRKYCTV